MSTRVAVCEVTSAAVEIAWHTCRQQTATSRPQCELKFACQLWPAGTEQKQKAFNNMLLFGFIIYHNWENIFDHQFNQLLNVYTFDVQTFKGI